MIYSKSYYYSMLKLSMLRRLNDGLMVAIVPILRLRKQWYYHAYFELIGTMCCTGLYIKLQTCQ